MTTTNSAPKNNIKRSQAKFFELRTTAEDNLLDKRSHQLHFLSKLHASE